MTRLIILTLIAAMSCAVASSFKYPHGNLAPSGPTGVPR